MTEDELVQQIKTFGRGEHETIPFNFAVKLRELREFDEMKWSVSALCELSGLEPEKLTMILNDSDRKPRADERREI